MIILRIILRVCFGVIVFLFSVIALIGGCAEASADRKLFPAGLSVAGAALLLAAAGCCIFGLKTDIVLAALGILCFFIKGFFSKEEDDEDIEIDENIADLVEHASIIRAIVYLVIIGVFALL